MDCNVGKDYDGDVVVPRDAVPSQRFPGWYKGKNLPHYDEYGIMQFITFRLCDSLPLSKREELEGELRNLSDEQKDIHKRKRIEDWLDAGYGCCALSNPEMAEVMEKALIYYDGNSYDLVCWCVMPNHVHFIISPECGLGDIVKSLKSYTSKWAFKNLEDEWLPASTGLHVGSTTSRRCFNVSTTGTFAGSYDVSSLFKLSTTRRRSSQRRISRRFWMPDYWDRYIRDEHHFIKSVEYIHNNPVKAGLCDKAEDWLWSSARYW